jgi:Iap family predicted aminopeptidase
MSGPFVTAKFDSIVSARAGIPAAIISSVTAIVTMQRFLNRFMLTHSL